MCGSFLAAAMQFTTFLVSCQVPKAMLSAISTAMHVAPAVGAIGCASALVSLTGGLAAVF